MNINGSSYKLIYALLHTYYFINKHYKITFFQGIIYQKQVVFNLRMQGWFNIKRPTNI